VLETAETEEADGMEEEREGVLISERSERAIKEEEQEDEVEALESTGSFDGCFKEEEGVIVEREKTEKEKRERECKKREKEREESRQEISAISR